MNWRSRKSNSAPVAEVPEAMADPIGRNPESVLTLRSSFKSYC